MSTSQKRIWIDVTDLNDWHGHMTGIQRVIYNVARRYAESEKYEAHGFVFDPDRRIFTEHNLPELLKKVHEGARDVQQNGNQQPETAPNRSTKQLLKLAPRALARRVPTSVKQRIPSEIKQGIKLNARLAIDLARHAKHALRAQTAVTVFEGDTNAVHFEKTDVVLVLGKSWDYPELIPVLGRLKQQAGFRLVHLIHDMIPILEPHLFGPGLFEPYTKCMFDVCALSDEILAQSESTERDIKRFCELLNITTPPIKRIRLADEVLDEKVHENIELPHVGIKAGNFILHVGTIEVRKNHALSYSAYREAALRGIELPTMVIVGGRGWLVGDITYQMEHDPALKDKFIFLSGLGDDTLMWLYKNCRFTVFPSTYEGWGIPVGESLAYGKVCITSKTSSMPEIAGPILDYISPYSTTEMLDQMLRFMDDKELAKKEKQIVKEYKLTTWDTTFKQVEAALASLHTQ